MAGLGLCAGRRYLCSDTSAPPLLRFRQAVTTFRMTVGAGGNADVLFFQAQLRQEQLCRYGTFPF